MSETCAVCRKGKGPTKTKSAQKATLFKERLFWLLFVSIVLGGTSRLFLPFVFLKYSYVLDDPFLSYSIICVMTGIIGGLSYIITNDIRKGDGIRRITPKIFLVGGAVLLGALGGGITGVGVGVSLSASKIYYNLFANIFSIISVAVGVIISALMGLIGFISGYLMAWSCLKEAELTAQLEEPNEDIQVSLPESLPQQEAFSHNQPLNAEERTKQKKQKIIGIILQIGILAAFFIVLFGTDKLRATDSVKAFVIISGCISLAFGLLSLLFRRITVIPILGLVLIYILCVVSSTVHIWILENSFSIDDICLIIAGSFTLSICISSILTNVSGIEGIGFRILSIVFAILSILCISDTVSSFFWIMLLSAIPGVIMMFIIIIRHANKLVDMKGENEL